MVGCAIIATTLILLLVPGISLRPSSVLPGELAAVNSPLVVEDGGIPALDRAANQLMDPAREGPEIGRSPTVRPNPDDRTTTISADLPSAAGPPALQ